MSKFARGLSDAIVQALNRAYDQGTWWRRIVGDPDLYLGIRKDYLNIYHKGNSLLKLTLRDKKLLAEVHYKYLLKPRARPEYIRFENGVRMDQLDEAFFFRDLDPDLLKQAAAPYVGEEKKGVHDIVRSNPNIVDVEIALAGEKKEAARNSAKRIDFATLQAKDGVVELIFFEAKHFTNKELRVGGEAVPPVVDQIRGYEQLLVNTEHREAIERAYRRVCANLVQLKGVREPLRCVAETVCDGAALTVNPLPRLVVFGFDEDQKSGDYWARHREKLTALGEDRILTRGNPIGFRKGISSGT
jgi:hypothetical protein